MSSPEYTLLAKMSSRLRYLWRLAIPLWLFRDAGKGSVEQRAANYRYNCTQRKVLPFYVAKWIGIAVCLLQLTRVLSDVMAATSAQSAQYMCATLLCMGTGIGFAFACVVIVILFASYLFLTYVKR